jgi:hypothetical protein
MYTNNIRTAGETARRYKMITDTRKKQLEKMDAKNHWAFTKKQLLTFLAICKEGLEKNILGMTTEEIIYRLENCNFNTLAWLFYTKDFDKAANWIETEC